MTRDLHLDLAEASADESHETEEGHGPDGDDEPDGAPSAGLVCWRPARDPKKGVVDVLVRRASADDPAGWTLPRAVRRADETLPEAAVRALTDTQASGVRLVPRLARPLDVTGPVTYWAGRLRQRENASPAAKPDDSTSTEELTWLPGLESQVVLADPVDREAVAGALAAAHERQLDTRPIVIVRHAKARPRSRWSHADADRPLVDLGREQAVALAGLLECWHPEYLLCSPWLRCVDTLRPYVKATGLRVRTRGGLSEKAHRSAPRKAAWHLRAAMAKGEAALVCTHRPVLPTILEQLVLRSIPGVAGALPTDDPFLSPSEVLVAHVATRPKTRSSCVVAVELHRPVL